MAVRLGGQQKSAMFIIGYLQLVRLKPMPEPYLIPFRQGLNTLGYTEDRNTAIEYRWTEFKNELG